MIRDLLLGMFKPKADAVRQKKSGPEGDMDVYLNGERRQVPEIEFKVLKAMSEMGGSALKFTAIATQYGCSTEYGALLNALTALKSRGLVEERCENILVGAVHRPIRVYDIVAGCELRSRVAGGVGIGNPAP